MPPVPAAGVEQGADRALLAEDVIVGKEEQVHHEADDLARGEVVPRLFVRGFIEFANEFFEGPAHFEIGDGIGVQVDFAELLDQLEEAVGFVELLDLLIETEGFEQRAHFRGEAVDIVQQILGEVVRVGFELFEIVLAGVVELLPGGALEHLVDVGGALALLFLVLFEYFGFRRFEDAIEPSEHCHGQHDLAVLGGR
jgi:hypothetical protein